MDEITGRVNRESSVPGGPVWLREKTEKAADGGDEGGAQTADESSPCQVEKTELQEGRRWLHKEGAGQLSTMHGS